MPWALCKCHYYYQCFKFGKYLVRCASIGIFHATFVTDYKSAFSPPRVEWMFLYQGMIVLATNQVWWTWEVEDVFQKVRQGDKVAMKSYAKRMHAQIDALVVQVIEIYCLKLTRRWTWITKFALLWQRKQVTLHLNLSYWCFHILPSVLFFRDKFCAYTLILLRNMLGKTSWYSIDISRNDRHMLLFYKKFHFCHLLPFAKVGHMYLQQRINENEDYCVSS